MDWKASVRAALGAGAPDEDVVEELAQHAAAAYAAERSGGATHEAAVRAALEQLPAGPEAARALVRPRSRRPAVEPPRTEARGLAGLGAELRHAARRLGREPGHSALVALTLAVGIGAATVLFSVVNGVLLEPLPWPRADRLVRLSETRDGATRTWPWRVTNAAYLAAAEGSRSIAALAAWGKDTVTWSGDGEPERVRIASVTASLFTMLDARPQLGTLFAPADETRGGVVVLSHGLWQSRFGGRSDALGRVVRLDGAPYRVVAVMPRGFAFPDAEASAWTPFQVAAAVRPDGTPGAISIFSAMARLREGATPAGAAGEITVLARHAPDPGLMGMALFGARGAPRISAVPARDALTAEVRPALLLLLAAVGLLVAAAVANVASLQLVRATARRRELAVRSALGAGPGRLARLLLAESLLLGVLGGVGGLALAAGAQAVLPSLLPAGFPRSEEIGIDLRVAGFAALLAVASGLGSGVLPALFGRRLRIVEALGEDAGGSVGAGRSGAARARTLILGGQVAIATVLLLGALQLGRSFQRLLQAERGYEADHVLTVRLPLPEPAYDAARRKQLVGDLLGRLRGLPGVADVAAANVLPLGEYDAMAAWSVTSPSGEVRQTSASVRNVTPGYFRALGRRVVEGRPLLETDGGPAQPVVVVNRTFARRYLDDSAVGASIPARLDGVRTGWTVVGVVEDAVQKSVTDPPQPEVLASWSQLGEGIDTPEVSLVLRTASEPDTLAPAVRTILREADPGLAPEAIVPMRQRLLESLAQPRLYSSLLAAFAAAALAVVGVGLFGALSYGVALRTREIGVRVALGARPLGIAAMVAGQAIRLTAAGLAAGLAASFALGRTISSFLYGVLAHDAAGLVAVPAALLLLAAAVSVVPAVRAARIDPQHALRAD
jgi:predicted permease